MHPSHESANKKLDRIINAQSDHEKLDNARFKSIEDDMKNLATKNDIDEILNTLKPIAEAWTTVRNGRNGLIWIASTIAVFGAAVVAVKGLFK